MSDISRILESVKDANDAARKERLTSPELVQKTRALRASAGTGIHHAFCKTDAPAGCEIICYLDEDETGEEIEVHCRISGGGNKYLNASSRRLENGDSLEVTKINDEWWALEGFQTSEDCVCILP